MSRMMVKDSCMASAINIYFETKVFKTVEQFNTLQKPNLTHGHLKVCKSNFFDSQMAKFVTVNSVKYKIHMHTPNLNLKQYRNKFYLISLLSKLENGKKYIIDYEYIKKPNVHEQKVENNEKTKKPNKSKKVETEGHFSIIKKTPNGIECVEPGSYGKRVPFTELDLELENDEANKKIPLFNFGVLSFRIYSYKTLE